ncbi:MAG: DEAD/DEAH box helicase family protein [Gemmataceae bacterium]
MQLTLDFSAPSIASGEKAKALDLITAIRTLKKLEHEKRDANPQEKDVLARFPGFGSLALRIFPDPVSGRYRDGWAELGEELKCLLTPEEYASAKRTTFNAFYTSPVVMHAMYAVLDRFGCPANALVLEPGCGPGGFMATAPTSMRFIGVELDSLSGRIARARFPKNDIRIESFANTKLPEIDAVVGNPPFADVKMDYLGQRLSLHDFFIRKSLDAVKPGGILALVTSHFTLDKQNAAAREAIAEQADFLGAIRLPSDAFRRQGTAVVTDILLLRKRGPGEPANHIDADWTKTAPMIIEGKEFSINNYFHHRPDMVLGTWSTKDTLYGDGYSLSSNGELASQLQNAITRLPEFARTEPSAATDGPRASAPAVQDGQGSEGSFFVTPYHVICQMVNGTVEPVVYGGTKLSSNGTLTGKRLAALIRLRDQARQVLRSQNLGWPEIQRQEERRELNRLYDSFVGKYGPINLTSFSETKDGSVIRRMPNLVKFKEDPDAMLVMSLEEYDEVTGETKKAPILCKDVVGQTPPITQVNSAEEGLLVSLDKKGLVNIPYIAELYHKPEATVIDELGDLIYFNPETQQYETADDYLSGNVRAKLTTAEKANASRNIEALRAVQPEDVLPGDIDAALGSPWIPVTDIQDFAAELFRAQPANIKIAHLERDAVWSVEGDWSVQNSVAATGDYGTDRINGLTLFEQALNMKSPIVYDVIRHSDGEERVVNQEATLAAKEKQKQIKERFRQWIFGDADRTERLVRVYNDTYNNIRLRHFDGSHLQFPGMSKAITLRPSQADAIWRAMSGGNTLLAHVVGAGKTWIMAAAGMKMKQTGLIKKPMFVVPNHMLEQFSREFMQLYPNAKLLVAGKDDFTRERRKLLTAKIASGEWDGIVVTHSSFERIGMSRQYQEQFLREQIEEYDRLLIEHATSKSDRAQRNIIKTIEKQKVAREEKLKTLLAQDKKDDGLVFDELGVDHIFVDEAQAFKNLETPTKMDRVAGIQTTGSERAFDLYMKARYLDQKHAGHGVTFATGTPISNTMVELYTMQRFLDPAGLKSRNIDAFDAWAATFGEVIEAMEIAPDGKSLRLRSRFAKFVNLPELQQMFRSFADVQTAAMLNLPRPALESGKAQVIACPMSEEQKELQDELVRRYERLRSEKIDPREDNPLNVTTDGRKLALDARMLSPGAHDSPGSKINALADKVAEIWQRSAATRGTQMVFCDMGVHPTPWGFSAYDEVAKKLLERGIVAPEIACIGEADSDAKKQALFEKVRQGSIRVLIGSTAKMGTGTNVQRRLTALHHLDAPWKPAEVEQREGRILRQGNSNKEVAVYRYVTQGSFDSYMWQALENKQRFISQVMTGQCGVRRAEDVGGQELSYAEVKAIASGNPAVLTLAEADAELQRLAILRKSHSDEQYVARKRLKELPQAIERLSARLAGLEADAGTVAVNKNISIGNRICPQDDVLVLLSNALNWIPERVTHPKRFPLGTFHGLSFGINRTSLSTDVYLEGKGFRCEMLNRDSQGPRAVMNALQRMALSYDELIAKIQKELALAQNQLHDYWSRKGLAFANEQYMAELTVLRDKLRKALSEKVAEEQPDATELAGRITALRNAARSPIPTSTFSERVISASNSQCAI